MTHALRIALSLALAFPLVAPAARAQDAAPPAPSAPPAPAGKGPDAARRYSEQGDLLRDEAKWAEAAKAYGKSLDADEGQYLVHIRYQEAVIRSGDRASLPAEYDEIVKDRASDPAARYHRLRLDPAPARAEALAKEAKAKPGDPYVLLELGRAQLAAGDNAGARKSLDAVLKTSPDLGDAFWLGCEAMRRTGDAALARQRYEDYLRRFPQSLDAALRLGRLDLAEGKNEPALARANQVLVLRPTHLGALLLKSEASSRLAKPEDARAALDAALRINPTDPDALIAAADLTAKGATEDGLKIAVERYKKALEAPGANALRGHYGLGWAYERLNQLKEADAAYREANLVAPGDAGVVNSIGVVLLKQKRFVEAAVQFRKAVDLDPKAPEAYTNLAAAAEQQQDWKGAIDWYAKVLAIKGQEKNIRALLNSAFDHEELTQFKKAEELLEKVRAIRPDDAEVAVFYGDNQMFQKKWKVAIKAYQEAVRLDEKNRFAWRGLGLALAADGKPQDAVDALEKSKGLKGDDQVTLLVLGDLYLSEIENLEKALENYKAYVKAGGNNPDVPNLIGQIEKEIEARKAKGK